MREADWVERLWHQIGQLVEKVATKQDVQQIEERLKDMATKEAVERLGGKIDTLLINAATKVEIGRIERQLEHAPTREDIQRVEVLFTDALPQLVTKQEWSAMESRLARTLTRDEFAQTVSEFRGELENTSQRLSKALEQIKALHKLINALLVLNGLNLALILLVLLRLR
ncbi:MAG: hypothetical protein NZ805_12855 [Armatimonadetes bacterium]|nr:hypothetical protein [Armatimonadota bacterium]MDW8027210.1 hypothetical protein [Armatimonadota bacterium]